MIHQAVVFAGKSRSVWLDRELPPTGRENIEVLVEGGLIETQPEDLLHLATYFSELSLKFWAAELREEHPHEAFVLLQELRRR